MTPVEVTDLYVVLDHPSICQCRRGFRPSDLAARHTAPLSLQNDIWTSRDRPRMSFLPATVDRWLTMKVCSAFDLSPSPPHALCIHSGNTCHAWTRRIDFRQTGLSTMSSSCYALLLWTSEGGVEREVLKVSSQCNKIVSTLLNCMFSQTISLERQMLRHDVSIPRKRDHCFGTYFLVLAFSYDY